MTRKPKVHLLEHRPWPQHSKFVELYSSWTGRTPHNTQVVFGVVIGVKCDRRLDTTKYGSGMSVDTVNRLILGTDARSGADLRPKNIAIREIEDLFGALPGTLGWVNDEPTLLPVDPPTSNPVTDLDDITDPPFLPSPEPVPLSPFP